MMKTASRYYRVDRRQINRIKFIFEAYEGLAVVTTLNAAQGLIRLAIAPGCEVMAGDVMNDLSRSIRMEALEPPEPDSASSDMNESDQ